MNLAGLVIAFASYSVIISFVRLNQLDSNFPSVNTDEKLEKYSNSIKTSYVVTMISGVLLVMVVFGLVATFSDPERYKSSSFGDGVFEIFVALILFGATVSGLLESHRHIKNYRKYQNNLKAGLTNGPPDAIAKPSSAVDIMLKGLGIIALLFLALSIVIGPFFVVLALVLLGIMAVLLFVIKFFTSKKR